MSLHIADGQGEGQRTHVLQTDKSLVDLLAVLGGIKNRPVLGQAVASQNVCATEP